MPKVWLVLIWIEAVVGSFLCGQKKWQLLVTSQLALRRWLPIICFLCLALFSSLWGVNFSKSWLGNYYRMDGLIVLLHLIALVSIVSIVATKHFWKLLARTLAASGSLLALTSLLTYLVRTVILHTWQFGFKFAGPMGQSNFLGGFLAITAPFTLGEIVKSNQKEHKLLWSSGLLGQFLGLIITQSKGSFVIFALGVGSTFLFLHCKNPKKFLVGLVLEILIGAGILGGVQITQNQQGFNAESRQRIFYKLALGIQQRSLQGWGWANVDKAFEANIWPFPILHDIYVDKAHSTLLEVLVTTGVFGLVFYLIIIGQTLRSLWVKNDKMWFLVFLLCVLQAQLNVISISQELLFWVCVAFSLQAQRE